MSHARILSPAGAWRDLPRRRSGRRGRLIDVLRVLLPLLAVILVALVLAWPQIMRHSGGIDVPTVLGDADEAMTLRMDSPRYVGRTSGERPYEVTARAAALDPLQANIVRLDQPAADIALADDGAVRLTAANGTYDRDTDRLLLDGGIEVLTSSGYRFVTPSARIDLAKGQVRGWQPIEGTGPSGTLSADRFEIQDTGDVLRFDGRVRVTVPPDGLQVPADEEATALPARGTSS
jgi:lipopolysaccharide export system protein LptC